MIQLPETIATADGPSIAGAGPELLRELLRELEREMAAQSVPVELFLPGLEAQEIRSRLTAAGRPPSDEIVVWFEWHNGMKPLDGYVVELLPRFQLWTLEQVATHKPALPYGTELWDWDPDWAQMLGDNYGVVFNHARDPRLSTLIRALGQGGPAANADRQAVSLCTPVTWWIEAIRDGFLTWDDSVPGWDLSGWAGISLERRLTGLV